MGILNRTPDSFYDKGETFALDALYAKAEQLVADGADILDIGGVKAGPGPEVTEPEEMDRVVPVVAGLVARFDTPISVDTWRASVARAVLRPRAPPWATTSAGSPIPTTCRPRPSSGPPWWRRTSGWPPGWPIPIRTTTTWWSTWPASWWPGPSGRGRRHRRPSGSCIDAGLDLGKTAEQSLTLLRASERLADLGYPLLLSASNKTFLGVTLDLEITERGPASLAAAALGISWGCRDAAGARRQGHLPGP